MTPKPGFDIKTAIALLEKKNNIQQENLKLTCVQIFNNLKPANLVHKSILAITARYDDNLKNSQKRQPTAGGWKIKSRTASFLPGLIKPALLISSEFLASGLLTSYSKKIKPVMIQWLKRAFS